MPLRDFPAAHSMDTTWFAVDRDGRVAAFESGEAGAVPVTGGDPEDVVSALESFPRREWLHVPLRAAYVGDSEHRACAGSTAIFHLKRAAAVAGELASGAAKPVPSEGSEAVIVAAPTEELLARVHSTGECLGCGYFWDPDEDGEWTQPGERGVYHYDHVCDNWIAGPYRLVSKPARPLHVTELPAALREQLVRFEGSFDETPLLQPVTHWECESWGAAWLDEDGRTVRAVPGHEDDFAEHVEGILDDEPGLVVVPPPGRPAPKLTRDERSAAPGPAPQPAPAPRKPWWKLW